MLSEWCESLDIHGETALEGNCTKMARTSVVTSRTKMCDCIVASIETDG